MDSELLRIYNVCSSYVKTRYVYIQLRILFPKVVVLCNNTVVEKNLQST